MEPVRDIRITLVDLLDRILDKGLLINADLIISVAGVPLIGVKLNAAIASIETMLKYGMMMDWSETKKLRDTWSEKKGLNLMEGERLISKFYGSTYSMEGLYPNWRPGWIYITDKRILLVRKEPFEVLAEIYHGQIERISTQADPNTSDCANCLYLHLKTGGLFQLRSSQISPVKNAIENMMNTHGNGPILVQINK